MKCWWLSLILCIMQYLYFSLQMEWKLHSFTIFCVTDDDFLHFCHFPCYSCYEVWKNDLYCDMWHGSSVWRLSVTCHKCEHSCHPNIRCEMSHWGPAPISLQGDPPATILSWKYFYVFTKSNFSPTSSRHSRSWIYLFTLDSFLKDSVKSIFYLILRKSLCVCYTFYLKLDNNCLHLITSHLDLSLKC